RYNGVDYLSENASPSIRQIAAQFDQLLQYLDGKPVSAVNDLYQPEKMVDDTDAATGATIRAPKVISAIWDALNRHAYRVE
ncbi:MAG: cytochrome b5 domain-containing protein, partial [Clostridia bacterium]|nr:cytochrome b5 domain-containing protein [Clostridia bacterium]